MLTLEHIDPRKGALVSGLENEFNEIIADATYNKSKNNRFVPYRVCDHPAPVTFGDIGEFLIEGEWVVCEFGGDLWSKAAREAGCTGTYERTPEHISAITELFNSYRQDPRLIAGRLKGAQTPSGPKQKKSAQIVGKNDTGSHWYINTITGVTCHSHQHPGKDWKRGRKL